MVEEREIQKRQIAEKIRIKDILGGRYVQEEGWTPNYVETDSGKKVSRANIIGAVVEKEEGEELNYTSLVLEDGSGRISIRVFGDDLVKLEGINVGDVVLVIGRPREYGSERYLLLEIIKKIEDKKWIEVRNKELGKVAVVKKEVQSSVEPKQVESVEEAIVGVDQQTVGESVVGGEISVGDKIIEFVRAEDKGEGVEIEEIVKKFENEDSVKNLLSEGELFEVKPGRVKVLE
ncbi:MAG: OB-fold nucleic acid binding domain-containing protein [Candidatus Woesearchaeota archaeon]